MREGGQSRLKLNRVGFSVSVSTAAIFEDIIDCKLQMHMAVIGKGISIRAIPLFFRSNPRLQNLGLAHWVITRLTKYGKFAV